jgi:hypothetical protein
MARIGIPPPIPARGIRVLVTVMYDVLSAVSELRAFEFCDEGLAKERPLRPYVWRRASAALEALGTGRARYLQDGYA